MIKGIEVSSHTPFALIVEVSAQTCLLVINDSSNESLMLGDLAGHCFGRQLAIPCILGDKFFD